MLKDMRELHRKGFHLHLLHPKSKRPIENNWTKSRKKTFEELQKSYRDSMNLGTLLGTRFGKGFLHVIDCDVKSKDPKHRKEMQEQLFALIPALKNAPCVQTGRGNGSTHFYILLDNPIAGYKLFTSKEKTKVHMPSAQPSRHELTVLPTKEIEKGIRIRNAWEVSVMGRGQQVVLPPSTHPDTGLSYAWKRNVDDKIPLIKLLQDAAKKEDPVPEIKEIATSGEEVDLGNLPQRIQDLIVDGEGSLDRSDDVYQAMRVMLKYEYSVPEILKVFLDRNNYLGDVAYDHAKTSDAARAKVWLQKYPLKRAIGASSEPFENIEPDIVLDDDKALAQEKELGGHWTGTIERTDKGDRPRPTARNAKIFLENLYPEILLLNEFTGTFNYGCDTPWAKKGEFFSDHHLAVIRLNLASKFRFEISKDTIWDALTKIALDNKFHPVREYLLSLEWDGVERLDTWMKDYLNASAPEPYLSLVSRKLLCAMVARVMEPGVKYDHVVILQGTQGIGKSTALRYLASDEWFTDRSISFNNTRDSVMTMEGNWLVELGELSGMRKADAEALKEFISSPTDKIRKPYARSVEVLPRQSVFVGTTNKDEYLRDHTGNRRFWPVAVGKCRFNDLKDIRDQLFAEAYLTWELGEKLYLDDKKAVEQSVMEQESQMEYDSLVDELETWFKSDAGKMFPLKFTMDALFSKDGPLSTVPMDRNTQTRVGFALRTLSYQKSRQRVGGRLKNVYVRTL